MNDIILIFFFLFLSAFFSASEIALFSLGDERIHALRKSAKNSLQKKRIARLEFLKSDPQRLLVTILIGNNIVNIAASALATLLVSKIALMYGLPEGTGLLIALVTGIMTLLILVFGEITPKAFAHSHALSFALISAPVLVFLQRIFFPIVYPFAKLTKTVSGKSFVQGLREEELKAALRISYKAGHIGTFEKELVERALEFDAHLVETVMTPREKVFALSEDLTITEALRKIEEDGFSRIPVFQSSQKSGSLSLPVIGIVTVHLILSYLAKGGDPNLSLKSLLLITPYKVPPSMKIHILLREFQKRKTHMALVYSEHGAFVGLITLEDVIEEIFGEFVDENDEVMHPRQISPKKFFSPADIELEQLEHFLQEKFDGKIESFPWLLDEENKTLGYFLLQKFQRFPRIRERVRVENDDCVFVFTVTKTDGERLVSVEFTFFVKQALSHFPSHAS